MTISISIASNRRIPEGTGWLLDGYPQNYNQAKMLEKALSGYDANAKEAIKREPKGKIRKSSLVPDPRPPPPPADPPSGIDVIILFDNRDELSLKRAAGRSSEYYFLYNISKNLEFYYKYINLEGHL